MGSCLRTALALSKPTKILRYWLRPNQCNNLSQSRLIAQVCSESGLLLQSCCTVTLALRNCQHRYTIRQEINHSATLILQHDRRTFPPAAPPSCNASDSTQRSLRSTFIFMSMLRHHVIATRFPRTLRERQPPSVRHHLSTTCRHQERVVKLINSILAQWTVPHLKFPRTL